MSFLTKYHMNNKMHWVAAMMLFALCSTSVFAMPDKVATHKDASGWKLKVNGEDFFVKGMVWGYSPRNENYTFNLWGQPEEFIKNVIDHDFGLMQAAGVNAIRAFSTIPPRWVTYINDQYGIKTAINPLMGRYGANVGGQWVPNPDYSDELTRKTLKADVLADIQKYKNVPGVLMFALGNESNYGLAWKSFEIENLPQGEQQREKAKYLYSLFAETIQEARKLDPNHPITIVNGDIQYLKLIQQYGADWDLLGVNAYRGTSFTGMWKDMKAGPDLPILFFEFGSDAFNAKSFQEDEQAQASYLQAQWQEMYNNSHGRGHGNSIGGFVFEWRDEWWKHKQTENLHVHDKTASWENGGYKFDYVKGQNNMNEEWFGITRLGNINGDGVYVAEPRMAYHVLKEVWKIDPYKYQDKLINAAIDNIDMQEIAAHVQAENQKQGWGEQTKALDFAGGELKFDVLNKQYDTVNANNYENGVLVAAEDQLGRTETDYGQSLFLDFTFQPSEKLSGEFSINVLGTASDSDVEHKYGDRINDENGKNVELYDFQATYIGESFDINAFYHVPRYHWGYEGDFFGFMRETTDMDGPNGQDIWNAKAPYGLELVGKQSLDGLKVVAGPEIYWGANPKVLLKYQFGEDKQYTFMHSQDVSQTESDGISSTETTSRKTRQTSLQGKFSLAPGVMLEAGGIISGTEKVDDTYDYVHDNQVYVDEVKFKDTLGFKAKLSFDLLDNAKAYTAVNYAGLVANGGAPLKEFGTELPYSEYGNKKEIEAGIQFTQGDYMIFPRVLYRENIIGANPLINARIDGTTLYPGVDLRNTDDDPFAVLNNRDARSAEVYLTYDPTPATPFYAWDNDLREDAKFAYNIGLTATHYPSDADSELFYYEEGGTNAPFGTGLPAEDIWLLKSKLVFNLSSNVKSVLKLELGKQQPTGQPVETNGNPVEATKYGSLEGKFIVNREHIISAKFIKGGWGTYDFQRQFNVKYPKQIELKYVYLLNKWLGEKNSSQLGIKYFYRTLDEYSTGYLNGENEYMHEVQAYFSYKF